MHLWRRRLARAMVLALTGQGDQASQIAEAALREADLHLTGYETGARFVTAVVAIREGDDDRSADLADACVAVARSIGDPGWEGCALALRVIAHPAGVSEDRILQDLVGAESAIQRCTSEELGWAGRILLGLAYRSQHLFELAITHQQAALEGPSDAFGMRATRLLPLMHLAETHLHWADDLEQLGESDQAEAIQDHRWLAAELAREAFETGKAEGADPVFLDEARMLELGASWREDPVRIAEELDETLHGAVAAGFTDHLIGHRARLAQMYAASGDAQRAIDSARDALTGPADGSDPMSEARLRYVAVALAADAGDVGARSGLEYTQLVARSWWTQRLSRLHSVQRVLVNEELIRRNHHYRREAREDPLTRVGNRRALDEHMSARTCDPLATVVIDVDFFKEVNDTYGHARGDDALCVIANLLTDHVREQDLVARIGGDEFAVVLDNADQQQTTDLVNRLRLALLDLTTTTTRKHLQVLRLSFGWASTAEGFAPSELVSTADARMYAEKASKAETSRHRPGRSVPGWPEQPDQEPGGSEPARPQT